MNKNINTLDDLFNKVELYNELKFELFKKDKERNYYEFDSTVLNTIVNILGLNQKNITSFCKSCNMQYPFEKLLYGDESFFISGPEREVVLLNKKSFISLNDGDLHNKKETFEDNDLYDLYISIYEYTFTCTKDNNHEYSMFLLIKREKQFFTITKIGQYPSMMEVWGFDFDGYKNQLNKLKAYNDFKKAELCFADGFVAGAYTYLRRVFEKMLNDYCQGIDLLDDRAETKIKACKDRFDPRIHSMLKNLYKILSKGIHELDDEGASDYYQYLKAVIVMQLQHIKEMDDKEKQTASLEKDINEIAKRIK